MTQQTILRDYEVRNAVRTLVFTAPERDIAITWAESNTEKLGPLDVEEVRHIERRTLLFRAARAAEVAA